MDLRGLLRPVGPLPAGVYWRRRLVLLAGVVVFLVVVVEVAGGGGGNGRGARTAASTRAGTQSGTQTSALTGRQAPVTPTPQHTAVHHSRPAAPSRRTPAKTAICPPGTVTLSVSADHRVYPAGVLPRFTMTITNSGTRPCRLDVGPAVRSFLLYSGNDRIWSSGDCDSSGHVTTTLAPKHALAYAVTWSRHRSAEGCPSNEPAALPGFYRLTAHLGSQSSTEALFSLD